MAIRFTCPHCGRVMDVGDKFAGQTGPCTACGKAITIPGSPAAAAGPLLPARRSGLPIWAILLIVAGCSVPVLGICAGLLLPAVMSVREAARRTTSNNNLKQIGLALHNFHSTQEHFPARAYSRTEGKPLLSWRVLILPFIEQADLYSKFRLDEPWDSENNRKLIPLMPAIYQNPSAPASPGMASYLAVCGKGLAFDGDQGRRLQEFTDGTSHTILVVEADPDRAVVWTKPDDWEYNATQPMAGLGHAHPNGFNALFVDGSVHFIPKTIDPQGFHALLTIDAGDVPPDLDNRP